MNTTGLYELNWPESGLLPAIVQSAKSGRVLMLAWMSRESLAKSIEIGQTVFWSRSRLELWHKGATSGNVQEIVAIEVDCDGDAVLIHVQEAGPACHLGTQSCFDTQTIFEARNEGDD